MIDKMKRRPPGGVSPVRQIFAIIDVWFQNINEYLVIQNSIFPESIDEC